MGGQMMKGRLQRDVSELDMKRGPLAHDIKLSNPKPPVPGIPDEYIYLPARGFMTGRVVRKGRVIRVIDLEGQLLRMVLERRLSLREASDRMTTVPNRPRIM